MDTQDLKEHKNKLEEGYGLNDEEFSKDAPATSPNELQEIINETISTLEHAKVFISSRQKMHKDGQELYLKNIEKLKRVVV